MDGDGRPDILCGNYWIRSPEQFDLPWHLFAIFPYNTPDRSPQRCNSCSTMTAKSEIVSQSELSLGLLTRFTKPEDPRKLWTEQRIAELHHPRVLIRTANGILVAEEEAIRGQPQRSAVLRAFSRAPRLATASC